MINWDKIDKKISVKKCILPVMIVTIIALCIIYGIIINNNIKKNNFAKEMVNIASKNENTIFSIESILLNSSANAVDTSGKNRLKDLALYQYTDIAIQIKNKETEEDSLSNKNTIKKLYIDNISIETEKEKSMGKQILNYINPHLVGVKSQNMNVEETEIINFDIVYTNEENENADYTNPTFYTDCSNPITLRYINNLERIYNPKEGSSLSFDGAVLKTAGISIEDINCKLKFKINIENNLEEYYSCWINFNIPLNDIYKGTTTKKATPSGYEYDFFGI